MAPFERRLSRFAALATVALIPFAGSCGESDSSPTAVEENPTQTATASVTAVLHDSSAVLPPGRSTMPPADSVDYDGVVTGSAKIEIYSEDGGWTSLGDAVDVSVDIYCEHAVEVRSDVSVPADTYSQLRLTLTGFEASVGAGAVVDGVTYDQPFVVTLGGGDPVVVEKSVSPFTLDAGASARLVFDLNTEVWMDDVVIAAGAVPESEVRAAMNVFIR